MSTCRGVNRNGKPCGSRVPEGALHCRFHDPAQRSAPEKRSDLSDLIDAIGSIRAIGIGAGLAIPLYGYACKQLHLSGYGIEYAQFASLSDLTLDAVQASAFVLAATALAALVAWIGYLGRKRIPEVVGRSIEALQRAVWGFRAIAAAFFRRCIRLLARIVMAQSRRWFGVSRRPEWLLRKAHAHRAPMLPVRPAAAPWSSQTIVNVFVVCLVLIASSDLVGRYGASRLARLQKPACTENAWCSLLDPLRDGVARLGRLSISLALSPAPRSVRLIGVSAPMPKALHAGWSTSTNSGLDIELLARNASNLFLRACSNVPCDAATGGSGVFVMSVSAAQGLSFTNAIADDPGADASHESVVQVHVSAPDILSAATDFAQSLSVAAKQMHDAADAFPRTVKAKGEFGLAPKSKLDLQFSPDTLKLLADSVSSAHSADLRAQYRMNYAAREFEDCLERRRLTRNLVNVMRGQLAADAVDCSRDIDKHVESAEIPAWLDQRPPATPIAAGVATTGQ